MPASPRQFESPAAALDALCSELQPLGSERVPLDDAHGRILAEPIVADRDSPPASVSAMDGFAVRAQDLELGELPIVGEVVIGREPPPLTPGTAARIVTGGGIPPGADATLKHEDVEELSGSITFGRDVAQHTKPGTFVRYAGENLHAGDAALDAGTLLNGPIAGTLAAFGSTSPLVARRVRVTVLSTGDEVLPPDSSPSPWHLRDSNSSSLRAMLAPVRWLDLVDVRRVRDDEAVIDAALRDALERSDAVFMTGGVSMGHRDFVPDSIRRNGGRVVFHRIPQKPGKPILGAVGPSGQAILALPGNPVSVLVTARRFGVPALATLAGRALSPPPVTQLAVPDEAILPLWWFRLVRRTESGRLERVGGLSSGDIRSAALADGFIETPPDSPATEAAPFYAWAWD